MDVSDFLRSAALSDAALIDWDARAMRYVTRQVLEAVAEKLADVVEPVIRRRRAAGA